MSGRPWWVRVAGHLTGGTALTAAGLHFALTDWGWYAEINGERQLMFTEPVGVRLIESGVVGLMVGWLAFAALLSGYVAWWRLRGAGGFDAPARRR